MKDGWAQSRPRFGPLADPLEDAPRVATGAVWVLPAKLTRDEAEARCRDRIQSGVTRPQDSHRADMEPAWLVWVPYWRVRVKVTEGGVPETRDRTTAFGRFVAGAVDRAATPQKTRETALLVCARSGLKFEPDDALSIPEDALVARAGGGFLEGEELVPDVPRDAALATAGERERGGVVTRVLGAVPGRSSVREVSVEGAAMVMVPLWLRRYRYEGEASPGVVEDCHVALSAHDGAVVSERHPAAWRAVAGRVSRFFSRR